MLSWEGQQIMGQAAIVEKLNVSCFIVKDPEHS